MKNVQLVSAEWCVNCQPVKAALQKLEEEGLISVEHIDLDSDVGISKAKEYNVRGVPTLICEDKRNVGAMTEDKLREWLEV